MRRRIIALTMLLLAVAAAWAGEGITMVKYITGPGNQPDYVQLHNGTSDTVYNVSFTLQIIGPDGEVESTDTIDTQRTLLYPDDTDRVPLPSSHQLDSTETDINATHEFKFELTGYNALDDNGEPVYKNWKHPGFSINPLYVLGFLGFLVVIAIAAIVLLVVATIVARRRGRSALLWFFLSLILTPLVTLIVLLILPNKKNDRN